MSPKETKDFNLGASLVRDNMEGFVDAFLRAPDSLSKGRIGLGATNALAGILAASLGREEARLCLQAALVFGLSE